jgi:LysM repeat protein
MLLSVKRPIGASSLWTAIAVAAATSLLLAVTSCGDNGGSAQSATTVTIQPTSYVVRDQATTTVAPTENTADAAGRSSVEQAYTVEAGDYPWLVANLFDVDLEELSNFNQWEADYSDFPGVGETVRIPPGAKFVDPNTPETTEAETSDTTDTSATTDTGSGGEQPTTPGTTGGPCDPGTYELEAGDYPAGVAKKFDVTIEALNEANAATEGYSAFYVGLNIVIPPPSDCQ